MIYVNFRIHVIQPQSPVMHSSKPPEKLKRYIDPTGELGNKGLTRGIWYVKHKLLLRKIFIITMIVWITISVGVGGVFALKYASYDIWQDKNSYVDEYVRVPNFAALHPMYQPVSLDVQLTRVIKESDDRYNFVTKVQNPNVRYLANVTYHYEYRTGQTEQKTVTLLPGREQFMYAFGHESVVFPSQTQLMIDDISWKRISAKVIPDIVGYMDERLDFTAEEVNFVEPSAEGALVPSIQFDLRNNTVYSFWEPQFIVELKRGGATAGVILVTEVGIQSEEVRPIEYRVFQEVDNITGVQITPMMNVFDQSVYIPRGALL